MGAISSGATASGEVRIPSSGKKFYPVLEGLRGAAAILVLFRHIPTYITPIHFQMSYLAVDLFFVLSGFVIANSYEDKLLTGAVPFRDFAVMRIIRIFPLYWIGTAIGLIALLIDGTHSAKFVMLSIVLGLLMLPLPKKGILPFPLNFPAWSLFFEFFANFAYAKFIKILNNKTIIIIMIISLVMLAFPAFLSGRALDVGWKPKTFIFGFPRVTFSFLFGVYIYRKKDSLLNFELSGPIYAAACIILAIAFQAISVEFKYESYLGMFIIAIVFPAIVALATTISVTGKTLWLMLFLGEISFPLYALHVPLYQLSHVLYGKYLDPYAPYTGLLFAVIAAAIALVVHFRIDTPLRQRLRPVAVRWLHR